MIRDAGDILDRLSILSLKVDRLRDKHFERELCAYQKAFEELKAKYSKFPFDSFFDIMYRSNGYIWDLESAIRRSQLDDDFVEAGKRAIAVRKVNSVRVGVKNIINELLGEGFLEKKTQHLSE